MINAHPGLPEFDYIKPASLAEASHFLAQHTGEARLFIGGTDTFVRMRDGFWKEKYLVDVKHLEGMDKIIFDPQAGLTIGAAVNMNRVMSFPAVQEYYPVLAEAAHTVASYQLRTRATIVGNICNASPAGDTIGPCMALRAELAVYGEKGYRVEPLVSFFKGPGKTALQPGDIVTAVHFPVPPKGFTATYIKLGRNKLGDLAIVGITAAGYPDPLAASGMRFRLVLASVAPIPLDVTGAEDLLASKPVSEALIDEAASLAMAACNPIDDVRGSSRYRKLMVRNLSKKALLKVWEELN